MNPVVAPAGPAPAKCAPEPRLRTSPTALAAAGVGLVALCALASACAPLALNVAIIFALAGPHQWLELRYLLSRVPARRRSGRRYFALGGGGAVLLAGAFLALPWLPPAAASVWPAAMIAWAAALVLLRGADGPAGDRTWVCGAALLALAFAWGVPAYWTLALVYLHPAVALLFLDREMRRHPAGRFAWRVTLATVPLALLALGFALAGAPALSDATPTAERIVRHAGAATLPGVSSHFLVAAFTFLELLHFLVWAVAMPALALRGTRVTDLRAIPLFRAGGLAREAVRAAWVGGALLVVALWAGFALDYPAVRDLYFSFAMLHVLVEVPFLARMT